MTRADIFKAGNVAVITGAALGIGRAMSRRLAEGGLAIIMVDLPGQDLDAAAAEVRERAEANGGQVTVVEADVSKPADIDAVKAKALAAHGGVHLLVNNAVTRIGRGFDAEIAAWRQSMEINLWGPVMAVNAFLPGMLASRAPCAIINVGSKQGITNPPGHPIYNMAKSALKTYTEALEHDLRSQEGNGGDHRVSAHLLVPGWTTTGKAEHKPGAWLPEQVVDRMIEQVSAGDFYVICPDGETTEEADRKRVLWAAGDITENRPALSRWHPDYADVARKACS